MSTLFVDRWYYKGRLSTNIDAFSPITVWWYISIHCEPYIYGLHERFTTLTTARRGCVILINCSKWLSSTHQLHSKLHPTLLSTMHNLLSSCLYYFLSFLKSHAFQSNLFRKCQQNIKAHRRYSLITIAMKLMETGSWKLKIEVITLGAMSLYTNQLYCI